MERTSKIYKLRRKLQVLAIKITSPEFISKFYFKLLLGYKLNLINPKTFNEKLQWLKLNYLPNNENVIMCADKYKVREYIEKKGKKGILNDLIDSWDNVYEINWEKLPNQFVLKCNHGCGYNIICKNKAKLDEKKVKNQLNKWMKEDFGLYNAEPHYDKIPKKIICEKFLDGDLTYYNIDGTVANFKNKNYPVKSQKLTNLLPQMIKMAEFFAKDFPMVRVDLFDVDGKIILSELTFSPGGALIPFDSYEADLNLGKKLKINIK